MWSIQVSLSKNKNAIQQNRKLTWLLLTNQIDIDLKSNVVRFRFWQQNWNPINDELRLSIKSVHFVEICMINIKNCLILSKIAICWPYLNIFDQFQQSAKSILLLWLDQIQINQTTIWLHNQIFDSIFWLKVWVNVIT